MQGGSPAALTVRTEAMSKLLVAYWRRGWRVEARLNAKS